VPPLVYRGVSSSVLNDSIRDILVFSISPEFMVRLVEEVLSYLRF
jgi:hypothetical protein